MELFVEYFVVLINGLLFMTTKATRIDLISLVYMPVYIFRKYIVSKLRYNPRYHVNSQSKLFKLFVRACHRASLDQDQIGRGFSSVVQPLQLIYTYIFIRCLSTRNVSIEFLTRCKQTRHS